MKIKVCGMRDGDNIRQVKQLGVDYIGMVFYHQSPRFVNMIPTHAGIIPDKASPVGAGTVGVFVDEMPQMIITRVVNFSLDVVQLHGAESPTLVRNLRRTIVPDLRPGLQIWKAITLPADASSTDIERLAAPYYDCADALLFDTRSALPGGSGQHFDWRVLSGYDGPLPFFLSGGIGPDDVQAVRQFRHPRLAGIDLNSRFETAPGLKDIQKLKTFLQQLNEQD